MSAHPYRTPAALPSSGVILAARALRSTRFVVPAGMAALVTAIAIFFACLALSGCAFFAKHPEDAGLAAKDAACVAFQLALGNEDPASIVMTCQLPADALKVVEDILVGHKKGLAAKRAAMAADGGAADAGAK